MKPCVNCGTQIADEAKFCASCGAAASPAGPPFVNPSMPGTNPLTAGATGTGASVRSAPMSSNQAGMVAYVFGFITGIVMLVMEPYKNDRLVRFHAFQSIFLSVAYVVVWIIWDFISAGLLSLTFSFWPVVVFFSWILGIGFFALWLLLLLRAYNNERFELPFIGPMAARQAG